MSRAIRVRLVNQVIHSWWKEFQRRSNQAIQVKRVLRVLKVKLVTVDLKAKKATKVLLVCPVERCVAVE